MGQGKVRVLIFHPALAPYRVDFFNELGNAVELKVVFLRSNLLSQNFNQQLLLEKLRVNHDFLLSGFDVNSRLFRVGVKKCVKNFQPDVVVVPEFSPISIWLSCLKMLSQKDWHLIVWTDDNVKMLREMKWLKRLIVSFVMKKVSGVVVCSHSVKRFYHSFYNLPEDRIAVSPIIRDEEKHLDFLKEILPEAKKISDNEVLEGKKIVLYVGRLVSIKGIDRLISAFAEVIKKKKNIVLVIVGDGPERNNLESLTKEKDVSENVIFQGRLEGNELHHWYLISSVFVLPSHFEAYGTVVNEALLAGLPVVCSSFAGASDLIVPGKNGDIFEPLDVKTLVKLLLIELNKAETNEAVVLRGNLTPVKFCESVGCFVALVNSLACR